LWLESPCGVDAGVGIVRHNLMDRDFFSPILIAGPRHDGYMFDDKYSLFIRFLSFFHFWLPFLLVCWCTVGL